VLGPVLGVGSCPCWVVVPVLGGRARWCGGRARRWRGVRGVGGAGVEPGGVPDAGVEPGVAVKNGPHS
jgi:hypothetical protein